MGLLKKKADIHRKRKGSPDVKELKKKKTNHFRTNPRICKL